MLIGWKKIQRIFNKKKIHLWYILDGFLISENNHSSVISQYDILRLRYFWDFPKFGVYAVLIINVLGGTYVYIIVGF